ncbi:MAG: S8 family peptidase [Terriglobales bacterium]
MINNHKLQLTNGRKESPIHSPAFSAAWGRTLVALLMLSAVPSFAGDSKAPNQQKATARPDSIVWSPSVVNTATTSVNKAASSSAVVDARPDSIVWSPSVAVTTVSKVLSSSGEVKSKFAPELQQEPTGDENGMITVIVQHKQMPTSAHLKDMQGRGVNIQSKLHTIRAVVMHVPVSMLAELANDPNVSYISPDRTQKMTANPVTEEFATAVQADVAASAYALNGTGIGVAVIDSGIAAHPDLNNASGVSRVVYSQSFVSGDTTTGDKFGHGTHVAGLIGGSGANSGTGKGYAATYAGMATNVNLINLRVLDQNGSGTDSAVIAAIQQAIALKSTYNIRVISMSLGRPVYESYTLDPVDQAVEAAWKAGIVVVCAAGNNGRYAATDGFATILAPGNDPAVITVGATMTEGTTTRVDDQIASYSSKGPSVVDHIVKPDLVAPGNRMVSLRVAGSTLDTTYPGYQVGPSSGTAMYYELSGTSMATPIVSGAVALLLQKTPTLTPDQVKARLMKTAWKGVGQYTSSHDCLGNLYNNEYDLFTYGAGYLDVDAALGNTDLASGMALSQTAVLNSNGSVSVTNTTLDSVFAGSSIVWAPTSVLWGNSIVWGSNVLSSTSIVWGSTSIVWGSTSVSGESIVWGSTSNVASATSALSDGDPGDN